MSAAGQILSLPKGGGSLKGIGEKFSPDLYTGTGNFTIPIVLPPGRNGFQPQLKFVYSTGNGNGPFGLGWSLNVPGITRKTSKGIPKYRDNSVNPEERDIFILSGAEDLVFLREEKNTGPNKDEIHRYYRPRTEGLFAKIKHISSKNTNHWEVSSKDGLVNLYGTPDVAKNDSAVVADPDLSKRTKVFAWKLIQTIDPFGNRIEYEYVSDLDQDNFHYWNQLYLKQIRYADYDQNNETKFLASVTFIYDDEDYPENHPNKRRPDPFSEYRSGFEIRTRKRCKRILIKTHTDSERLVRGYELIYLDERNDLENLEELPPLNDVSLLSQIKVIGYDDNKQPAEELPPLEFGYTQFEPKKRKFSPVTGQDMPPTSLANPNYEMADLMGNGLPDIVEMNGTVRYWRNLGNGKFDIPREMRDAPSSHQLADHSVQLIDADGDGRIDLLVNTEGESGYYPLRFGGMWDRRSFQRYKYAPSFNFEDPEVKLVDLDGDGITDVIRSGNSLECYFNDQHKGFIPDNTRRVERKGIEVFPNINFSDQRVKWADMTGDGLQDIVLVYDGNVEYWPNLGRGNWGKRVRMEHCPRFPYGYDPKRILIGDVDGDGLADIVYVDNTKVTLWINQSGNRWSDKIEIKGTPPVSDIDAVRLVDMFGSGISGVLWSMDKGSMLRESMFYLDFTGGIKPYLLNEMNNHMGAVTRVGYVPSTKFYLEDEKRPKTRWKTPLPFPVQVVACVEVIDEISQGKLTTEYRYHHGYWDGAEREFRGFGMVEHLDTEIFEEKVEDEVHFSPPTLTKTWFHQGPIGDEFGGWEETDFNNEFWPGDKQKLTRPQNMIEFLMNLPRRVKRDALRALRGNILRTELYALDGIDRQSRPYSVTEYLHGVCGVIDDGDKPKLICNVKEVPSDWKKDDTHQRIFFPHSMAQRTTQWERGDDPMTQFTFTDDYDNYGQPCRQTQIACPRGWRTLENIPNSPYLATCTRTVYVSPNGSEPYIFDRVARTTLYEIENKGDQKLLDLKDLSDDDVSLKTINQTLNFYDRDTSKRDNGAFLGLPFGQIGAYGALVRTATLVLTEDILKEAYGDEKPPYLVPDSPSWTAEYPQEFRDLLPENAGYIYKHGGAGSEYVTGYYVCTERRRYDFHDDPDGKGRGLIKVKRDSLGHDTTIIYDAYALLPVEVIEVTETTSLETKAEHDYRVLQPHLMTDPNGNRICYTYTPIGLLKSIAIMGKKDEEKGDTEDHPGTIFQYDFMAVANSPPDKRQPIFVHVIKREQHYWNLVIEEKEKRSQKDETLTEEEVHEMFPDDEIKQFPERFIQSSEYSDGFGRLVQTRAQAEDVTFGDAVFGSEVLPADQNDHAETQKDVIGKKNTDIERPNVVVSGWQIYDNKGRVVERYEPLFSTGWDYAEQTDDQKGKKVVMYYDPRGHVIRTVNPDGSEQRVVYGFPGRIDAPDLTDPEFFEPTPWEAYTYDANDNAGRTHHNGSLGYQDHWNTPTSALVDALGRTTKTVERNGTDWYTTTSEYDLRGNLLSVTDALGRRAFAYDYDLINNRLRMENIDAGIKRIVLDAAGNIIEQRDSKGALILHAYDSLNRLIRLWARDGAAQEITLREYLIYGDSKGAEMTLDKAAAKNLLGKLYRHYDEAGLLTSGEYDFKGNNLEKMRKVISNRNMFKVFETAKDNKWEVKAFRVSWKPPSGKKLSDYEKELLDATEYRTSFNYDALNRIKIMRYPQDVDKERKELRPHYNRAGALERVELNNVTYVEHIAYNAKGQRTLIVYGNNVMTRYAYDPATFHLVRMRTEKYKSGDEKFTYRPGDSKKPLQDFGYEYDLAGNLLALHDQTHESGLPVQPDHLERVFAYDPLYRLLSATGRQCGVPPANPWYAGARCSDPTKTRSYMEKYEYDKVGNMGQMVHQADSNGFTRDFKLDSKSNRLATVIIGKKIYHYSYDENGNLTKEKTSRHFEWDHSDRMRVYRTQLFDAEPSTYTHCFYDSTGQRVMKLVRQKGGKVQATVYIEGVFEHYRLINEDKTEENNTLHVMDNQKRIVLLRVGPRLGDTKPAVKYQLGDHLGSSNVVIDKVGNLINREEYMPYGETSFGSFARKRYRFTGKERDEESGLYYHGARYYAPWLARWVSCDPDSSTFDNNLYTFVNNNPIKFIDPEGLSSEPPNVNNTMGLREQEAQANLFEERGQKVISSEVTIDSGKGGSRVDNIVGKKGPTKAVESKGIDVSRKTYRTRAGELNISRIKSRVRAELSKQGEKHLEALKEGARAGKDLPTKETFLYGVKGAKSEEEIKAVRRAVQDVVKERALEGRPKIGGGAIRSPTETVGKAGLQRAASAIGKVATIAGGAYSAYSLYNDIQRHDVASGIGNAANVASSGLGIAASAVGSTALAGASAVTGAFALGYGVGGVINQTLPENVQMSIGGAIFHGLESVGFHPAEW
jgi:RHS repeat-associated protein